MYGMHTANVWSSRSANIVVKRLNALQLCATDLERYLKMGWAVCLEI